MRPVFGHSLLRPCDVASALAGFLSGMAHPEACPESGHLKIALVPALGSVDCELGSEDCGAGPEDYDLGSEDCDQGSMGCLRAHQAILPGSDTCDPASAGWHRCSRLS